MNVCPCAIVATFLPPRGTKDHVKEDRIEKTVEKRTWNPIRTIPNLCHASEFFVTGANKSPLMSKYVWVKFSIIQGQS